MPAVNAETDCPFDPDRPCPHWGSRESDDTAFLITPSQYQDTVGRRLKLIAERRVGECQIAAMQPPSGTAIWCDAICSQIIKCQFVIVLLTESDLVRNRMTITRGTEVVTERNANVYFEFGLAVGLRKRRVLVARKGTDLPFDTGTLATVFYTPEDLELTSRFEQTVLRAIEAVYPSFTKSQAADYIRPLWDFYHKGGKHKVLWNRCVELLEKRGRSAYTDVLMLVRSRTIAADRIEAGVKAIFRAATGGIHNTKQRRQYVSVAAAQGSYRHVVDIALGMATPRRDAVSPGDVNKLGRRQGTPVTSDTPIPCDDNWSFDEPLPPALSELGN